MGMDWDGWYIDLLGLYVDAFFNMDLVMTLEIFITVWTLGEKSSARVAGILFVSTIDTMQNA